MKEEIKIYKRVFILLSHLNEKLIVVVQQKEERRKGPETNMAVWFWCCWQGHAELLLLPTGANQQFKETDCDWLQLVQMSPPVSCSGESNEAHRNPDPDL